MPSAVWILSRGCRLPILLPKYSELVVAALLPGPAWFASRASLLRRGILPHGRDVTCRSTPGKPKEQWRLTFSAFPNFPEWRGSCNRTRRDTERKLGRRGADRRPGAGNASVIRRLISGGAPIGRPVSGSLSHPRISPSFLKLIGEGLCGLNELWNEVLLKSEPRLHFVNREGCLSDLKGPNWF